MARVAKQFLCSLFGKWELQVLDVLEPHPLEPFLLRITLQVFDPSPQQHTFSFTAEFYNKSYFSFQAPTNFYFLLSFIFSWYSCQIAPHSLTLSLERTFF